ncbi:MAG: hypothetical protein AB8B85_04605, partial [Paracoccaceae bacterium]
MTPLVFAASSQVDETLRGKETSRLLNMYPEKGGKGPVTIRSVPGLLEAADLGAGRVREMISGPDGIYAAVGGSFVRWNGAATTVLGNLPDGVTTMARNATQIAVTAGGGFFVWDGAAFTQISGQAFLNIGSVDYLNSFFILTQVDGEAYQYSAAGDATSLAALDFASAETKPDKLRRVVAVNGVLWFLGEDSVEPWQNTTNVDLPFTRLQSSVLEKGLRSTAEVTQLDNTFMWVSNEGRAYRQQQFQAVNIGTDAVAAAMNSDTDVTAFAYQFNNRDFFALRRGNGTTFIYDPGVQAWHERSTGPTHQPWEVTATVHHDGVWYAGTETGELCTFSGYQDRGKPLRREAQSDNLFMSGERFSVDKVDIQTEGAGNVMSKISGDGGPTFEGEEIHPFGATYGELLQYNGLG